MSTVTFYQLIYNKARETRKKEREEKPRRQSSSKPSPGHLLQSPEKKAVTEMTGDALASRDTLRMPLGAHNCPFSPTCVLSEEHPWLSNMGIGSLEGHTDRYTWTVIFDYWSTNQRTCPYDSCIKKSVVFLLISKKLRIFAAKLRHEVVQIIVLWN